MSKDILCFFYGSFMNREVMAKANHVLDRWEVATLPGFDLRIAPHANLIPSAGRMAFGLLTPMTHAKLDRLYGSQSRGEEYLPESVLVLRGDNSYRAATTYLVSDMEPGTPDQDYLEMIAKPAQEYGFPDWYVEKIRSFIQPHS